MSFMQRLAQRPIFTSPGMNRTNQEPREGPRSRRATSPVVTENRRRWLSPASPTDHGAWPKARPREPEVTPPRSAFSGGRAPASSQACARGGPGEWNHHPVPACALASLLTACSVPAYGSSFALNLVPAPRSPIGQKKPRPR